MFEKISIFVSDNLRELAGKRNEEITRALGYALAFPSDLIRLYLLECRQKEDLPAYLRRMYKFFDGGYCERNDTHGALEKAHCVEATLGAFCYDVVKIDVKFYQKEAKNPFYEVDVSIDSNGHLCGCGRAIHSVP